MASESLVFVVDLEDIILVVKVGSKWNIIFPPKKRKVQSTLTKF